ncbi:MULTISPECIES: type II secretion system F family protein [unclassified Motilimonas]|uniref:type II secretion system F family protein n=1 Tax=unclassified Motilimonas TaxID=2643697 RepID=UPI001E423BF6|nr:MULTISPECIES: type II secretion system F family protein [unclassified Motilimonas]MCE0558537.1 type II secretion system F family protein [Motilimonas sp. E26]MDO6527424.1 type II secretion system F family protein [Motilimonas sp. 1_MG-2023]
MYFEYVARQKDTSLIDGWVQAKSKAHAQQVLDDRGLNVLVIKRGLSRIPLTVSREALLTALRELASLRSSGMPLDKAVSSLSKVAESKVLRKAWTMVLASLENGLSLSDAMETLPHVFPQYVPPMLRLGEANGDLPNALYSVAERVEREENLLSEMRSALTYPAFLLFISFAIMLFLFSYVLPNFKSMVEGGGGDTALASLIAVSDWVNNNFDFIILSLFISIALLWYAHHRGALQAKLFSLLAVLPITKRLLLAWDIVQFSSSMQRLLDSGVELVRGVELSAESLASASLKKRLDDAVVMVKQGSSLSTAMAQLKVFPDMVLQMINTGESGANLGQSFGEINTLYERRLKLGLHRVITLLEPAVIVIMGGLIGSIMVVIISGIISVNEISF